MRSETSNCRYVGSEYESTRGSLCIFSLFLYKLRENPFGIPATVTARHPNCMHRDVHAHLTHDTGGNDSGREEAVCFSDIYINSARAKEILMLNEGVINKKKNM